MTIQYSFIPKFLSFQGQVRPKKAYLKFFDGTKRELRTGEYWILRNSQIENVGGVSPDDFRATFANENITGVLQVPKDPQGGLAKKDFHIQIFCADSEATPFLNLKIVAINLALFLDNGKVQDLIPFRDIGLGFAFQMEVVQILSPEPA